MRFRVLLLFTFFCTFFVYASSFFNPFIWDDEQFIYKNVYVIHADVVKIFTTNTVAGASVVSNYYRPLTTLTFALDYALWGKNPFGFHLTNTFLHATAAVLVSLVVFALTKRKKTSFFIGLLFAVHPLQTEAVTYINSRGDSLSAIFTLLSALSFWCVLQKKHVSISIYNECFTVATRFFAVLCLCFAAASILSKEIGIAGLSIPFLLFFHTIFKDNPRKVLVKKIFTQYRSAVLTLLSLSTLAVGYLLLRATVLNFDHSFNFYTNNSVYAESVVVRLATFSRVLWTYFRLIFAPFLLHMERDQETITSLFSFLPLVTLLFIVLLSSLSFYLLRAKKNARALLGLGWFFILLAPVSGVIAINGVLYEHWLYLPQVGVYIWIAAMIEAFVPASWQQKLSRFAVVVLFFICIIFSGLTVYQNYVWGDTIRFYTYTLGHAKSLRLYNNLGMAYADAKRYDEALAAYTHAQEIDTTQPVVYYNKGNTYVALHDLEQAVAAYKSAITADKNFFYTYAPLIQVLMQQKKYVEAEMYVRSALQLFPSDPQFYLLGLKLAAVQKNVQLATDISQQARANTSNAAFLKSVDTAAQSVLHPTLQ